MEETRSLYAEINLLRNLLTAVGIPVPNIDGNQSSLAERDSKIQASTEASKPDFTLQIQQTKNKNRRQQIFFQRGLARSIQPTQDQGSKIPVSPADASVTSSSTREYQRKRLIPWLIAIILDDYHAISPPISDMTVLDASSPRAVTYLGELDPTVVGMDFVLS